MGERLALYRLQSQESLFSFLSTYANGSSTGRTGPQLRTINDHLASLYVRAAVVQHDVQDPDFLAEHCTYYAQWALPVPRFCTRIHFFSTDARSDDVLEAIDAFAQETDAYLGFLTLRPVANSPIGPTFLKKPPDLWHRFIRTYDEYPVNLGGQRFFVPATPFMEQDNAVGACAQASIWMALRTLRWREGRSAFSPAEITTAATRFVVNGRTLPNRDGLRIEQITEAIRAAGYSPHVIPLRSSEDILNQDNWSVQEHQKVCRSLYPYIESGIPVLLALLHPTGGHAIVAIGHGWTKRPMTAKSAHDEQIGETTVIDASCWASPFVIHNDNSGAYLDLPPGPGKGYTLSDAFCAIPLLSADILVDAEEARNTCINLLANLASSELKNSYLALPNELVTRTRLLSRSFFRREVVLGYMNQNLKRYYRQKWLPRHVWAMELSPVVGYEQSPDNGIPRLGEILLEPSADPKEAHFLTVRLNGMALKEKPTTSDLIIDRDAFSGNIRLDLI